MRPVLAAVVAVSVLAVTGCSGAPERAAAPGDSVDDLGGAGPCPTTLPRDPDDELAVGTEEPAERLPSPGEIDEAWVCTYGPPAARGPWRRSGEPIPVEVADLVDVRAAIQDLELPPDDRLCTADLGPQYLVVTAREGEDLTGYAVDDFGCRDVRITDDPFDTVPGDPEQVGTVAGVLDGGRSPLGIAKEYAGSGERS